MSNEIVNSRLSILYFDKSFLYTEDHTVIEQDDDITFGNNLIIKNAKPTDVYFQERYNVKVNNTNSNVKFTYSNANKGLEYKNNNIFKPLFLERGFNQYVFNGNNTRFDNSQDFIYNIRQFLTKYDIKLSAFEDMFHNLIHKPDFYDSIELTIVNDKLVFQLTYPQHSFEEEKIIDLNEFSDTGMFFTVKENTLDTNVQGMIYKLNENKFQKTNFYISLYENDFTNMDLFKLDFKQEGIHPEISIENQVSKDIKVYNPFANDCSRYLLFNIPKQSFVNKFDNEIKFDDEHWKLVDISEQKIDLEIPDYKIDSYDNAYYLFKKENFKQSHMSDISKFKFNLHNRYIDSAVPNQKGYSSFDFEYFAFDHCSDPSREFIMTPFNQKSHLGGYYAQNFANPLSINQGTYSNLLKHGIETIEIPYPNTNNFYKIQLATWIVVIVSMFYILKKTLFYKRATQPKPTESSNDEKKANSKKKKLN